MFHFRQHNSDTVYGVLIDISSGSVGVAIVMSAPTREKLPRILYTHRNTMRISSHTSEKFSDIRTLHEALFSALLTLSQDGLQVLTKHDPKAVISKLFLTSSSPWSYTVSKTVHYENDEPFKITETVINDLIQSAETEIFNHLHEQAHTAREEFSVVERVTVDMTVNDYPVLHPINLCGVSLGLSHVAGIIPQDIIDAVHEVQEKLFPNTELKIHTYMLVMFCVMRDIFPRLNSMCMVDITAESTEFAVVDKGLLIENEAVAIGSSTFVRNVMVATDKPANDIQSYMAFSDDDAHLVSPDFDEQIQEYEHNLTDLITQTMSRHAIPTDIIVTTHKQYEHFFAPIIARAFEKALNVKPNILSIKNEIIEEISEGAEEDVYIAISARFFHKLHGCGELDYK